MANQTYRLVISGNCAGQFVQNIFHYRMDDDSFTNRFLAAKGLVDGFLAGDHPVNFLAMLPDAYVLKSVKARRVTAGGGPEYTDTSLDGSPGTLGSDTNMSGSGPVIIWLTNGGARRLGKTFLAGLSPTYVDGGEITDAGLSAINGAATDFRAVFNAIGGGTPTCTLVVPRSNDLSTRSLVVGNQVSKNVGLQRRRQLPV